MKNIQTIENFNLPTGGKILCFTIMNMTVTCAEDLRGFEGHLSTACSKHKNLNY